MNLNSTVNNDHPDSFVQDAGTFTDRRDGKIYKTIKIGRQIIMAENLAFDVKGECHAYEGQKESVEIFGYLYSWSAAKKAAGGMRGWHLPSKREWKTLIDYLGGGQAAGKKMKGPEPAILNIRNGASDNSVGFNGLAVGYYSPVIKYANFNEFGFFWSKTPHGPKDAWRCRLHFSNNEVELGFDSHYYCYSVRLIKNRLIDYFIFW